MGNYSEDDVLGWLASNEADQAANYANRGRIYRDLSHEELAARWVASFRQISADLRNYEARAVNSDVKSELDLRSLAPPYDLVRDEFEKFTSDLISAIEEMKMEDPCRYAQLESDIQRDVDTFKEEMKNEKS